jgi:hypothetical protein
MGITAIIVLIIATILFLVSQSYNGHEDSGCLMGLCYMFGSFIFVIVGLIFGCIWIGMHLK